MTRALFTRHWQPRMHDPRLMPYAADPRQSRGRKYDEEPSHYRDAFQRDRDRIVHSSAFRRLVYKTQVFVNHEGDLYRTRLTHSLEVAQIARSVANALGLNETLAEAISLAHDLGHTPFGHAGQDALNDCMVEYGGFEHNLQSLRVVDELEEKYADFPGLNLCFETREGILKHCSARNARDLGELGQRFLDRTQPGAEAQIANIADAIAYNNHDIDDGLRAGLLTIEQLSSEPLFQKQYQRVRERYPELSGRRLVHEIIRRMIGLVVRDLIEETQTRLSDLNPASIDDIREAGAPCVSLSDAVLAEHQSMKKFLRLNLYRHHRVVSMTTKAARTVRDLFSSFFNEPLLMPRDFSEAVGDSEMTKARVVADYIAGMTDRFAIKEHARIHDPETSA